jgi:hypothetical protein
MNKPKLLNVYCCSACSEVEVKTSTPRIKGCKKSFLHNWVFLGEKGIEKYVCKNCGVKVNMIGVPATIGCAAGKSHEWERK